MFRQGRLPVAAGEGGEAPPPTRAATARALPCAPRGSDFIRTSPPARLFLIWIGWRLQPPALPL
jgi:hypothetical protein